MKFIKWTKKIEIGISKIDEQHKELMEIIEKTHEILLKEDKSKLKDILNELIEFTRIHFTTEENYFKKWDYPYAYEHINEHEKILSKSLQIIEKFDKEGSMIMPGFLDFLKEWWATHIPTYDFKYRDYFKEKGFI